MKRGDLSNISPARWAFTLDVLTDGKPLPKKRLWVSWEEIAYETPLSRAALNASWLLWNRTHILVVIVTFGVPQAYCDALEIRLEREGADHIRYIEPYADRNVFSENLTFRPDIQTVVDLPEHAGKYGGRGWTMREVSRLGR